MFYRACFFVCSCVCLYCVFDCVILGFSVNLYIWCCLFCLFRVSSFCYCHVYRVCCFVRVCFVCVLFVFVLIVVFSVFSWCLVWFIVLFIVFVLCAVIVVLVLCIVCVCLVCFVYVAFVVIVLCFVFCGGV